MTFPNRCLKCFFLSRSERSPQIITDVRDPGRGGVDGLLPGGRDAPSIWAPTQPFISGLSLFCRH